MAKSTNPKNAGRPALPEEKKRTGLHINQSVMKDIKYISYSDETTITDIVNEALENYVKQWTQKNGTIPKK